MLSGATTLFVIITAATASTTVVINTTALIHTFRSFCSIYISLQYKTLIPRIQKLIRKKSSRIFLISLQKNICVQRINYIHGHHSKIQCRVGLIFCGYIGEAPASTPKPKKLLRFADHQKKIPVLSGIPKKILELLAYPKKLHVFIFFMPIDGILSHPYDLSCWWDVKSQINQPTEHVTIQLVYVVTRK